MFAFNIIDFGIMYDIIEGHDIVRLLLVEGVLFYRFQGISGMFGDESRRGLRVRGL